MNPSFMQDLECKSVAKCAFSDGLHHCIKCEEEAGVPADARFGADLDADARANQRQSLSLAEAWLAKLVRNPDSSARGCSSTFAIILNLLTCIKIFGREK